LDQHDLPALHIATEKINAEFGYIDILFANAGIQAFRPLLQMEDPDWHIQIDVNLAGTANALRGFAPYMVEHGRIIMTTSA
jgi:NAD(P)-dependent dehydrogenase (short-subunit alcohol dehydrogenase family)